MSAVALRRRRQFLADNFSNEMLVEMGKTLNAFLQGFFPGDPGFQVDIPAPQDAAAVKQLIDDTVAVDARLEPERSPLTLARLADRADMEREARVRGVCFGRNDTDDALLELLMQGQVITGEDATDEIQARIGELERRLANVQPQQIQMALPSEFTEAVGGIKRVLQKLQKEAADETDAKKQKTSGVLGLHTRWKTSGDVRFQRWVSSHMKQQKVQREGTGKWVVKLKAAQEAESKAEESLHDYQDEHDDAEGDGKLGARVRLDEAFRMWIEALEELRVVHKCWKEKSPQRADHLYEVYMERRYGTKEDKAMEDMEKEADARTERDWTVETNHFLQESRVREARGSVFGRLGRQEDDQRRRQATRQSDMEQSGNTGRRYARRAEDVFRQCPAEIQGKYVTVGGFFLFEEPKLEMAASWCHRRGEEIPWNVYPKPVCFFCKGADHQSWECDADEYEDADGKNVVPPLRLHKLGLVCGRGRVYMDVLRRE